MYVRILINVSSDLLQSN